MDVFIILVCIFIGVLTLTEPLEHDHLIHTFLDPGDLQQADPLSAVNGSSPWWGDGGFMAPEVGILTRNIVIQGSLFDVVPPEEVPVICIMLLIVLV